VGLKPISVAQELETIILPAAVAECAPLMTTERARDLLDSHDLPFIMYRHGLISTLQWTAEKYSNNQGQIFYQLELEGREQYEGLFSHKQEFCLSQKLYLVNLPQPGADDTEALEYRICGSEPGQDRYGVIVLQGQTLQEIEIEIPTTLGDWWFTLRGFTSLRQIARLKILQEKNR
jgi:hypothetical protein